MPPAASAKRKADDITKDDEQAKKDDVVQVAEEVAAAAAAAAADADAPNMSVDVDDDDDGQGGSKRRFFPRVKHLLTREWEPFLGGVLDALDEAGAPSVAAASHKPTNAWFKAFDLIYNGVARDCSVPHGKNRYHKFKDKIVELWQAVEDYTGDDLALRDRTVEQFETYKKACALQATTPKKESGGSSSVTHTPKTPSSAVAPRTEKQAARRSVIPPIHAKWKHLDEAAALESLPEPLKNLVHIRNLSQELNTGNRLAIEEQYDRALQEYMKEIPEAKEALFEKSLALAFLSRSAQSNKESKDILAVYDRVVTDYLLAISTTLASV